MDKLKKLYNYYSVSSCEKELNKYLKKEYRRYTDICVEDNLYSIFAKLEGKNPQKIMIACAMDEIGMMTERVLQDGSLKFICLESLSPASLLYQRVSIITREDDIYKGVISIDQKILEDKIEEVKIEDLKIDVFYPSSDSKKVKPGDLIALESALIDTENLLIGRALNQKVFQKVELEILEKLKGYKPIKNLFVGSIAQSTIGFRGTKTANYVINPDIAIVLTAFEVNKSSPKVSLGDGVLVGYYDSQMIPDQCLLKYITNKYDVKPYIGLLGNDGSFIHKTMDGVKTISVGIPMKNLGSASVIVSKEDIEKLINFLVDLIINLDNEDNF